MELVSLKCPSCGAGLPEGCRQGNRFVCDYCGGTVYVNDVPAGWKDPAQNGQSRESRSDFRYSTPLCFIKGKVPGSDALNIELDEIMELQKRYSTSEAIEPELIKTFEGRKEVTTETWQAKEHQAMIRKIGLEPGERMIMFKSAAFIPLNRFRCGIFLTDRRVGYFEHGKAYAYNYGEVSTFRVELGIANAIWWYPNENEKVFISALGCDDRELALLLTFVLLKIAEATPDDSVVELKIKL